jgi:hypothetical protein
MSEVFADKILWSQNIVSAQVTVEAIWLEREQMGYVTVCGYPVHTAEDIATLGMLFGRVAHHIARNLNGGTGEQPHVTANYLQQLSSTIID